MKIKHTKILLKLDIEIEGTDGHACEICCRDLDENEKCLFDILHELEVHITKETCFSLVYIAGYVQRYETLTEEDTFNYYKLYGDYLRSLNRGGLKIPTDTIAQWTFFCFIYFTNLSGELCAPFCAQKFSYIAERYNFNVTKRQCYALTNIFLKNKAILSSPKSTRETKLKVLKLS